MDPPALLKLAASARFKSVASAIYMERLELRVQGSSTEIEKVTVAEEAKICRQAFNKLRRTQGNIEPRVVQLVLARGHCDGTH